MQLHFEPKLLLGILGNGTSMALFLSPMPTFVRIWKLKSTEEFSGLPYACTLFNCLLWILYGLPIVKPHSMLIITINVFGVAMELFFVSLYVTFATKASKIKMTIYMSTVAVLYTVIITITLFAIHSLPSRQLVVGSICVVLAIAMYAAPLSIMGLVIRTKSVEYMPFTLSLCNVLNSTVWSAYSLVTKDIFVGIPNGIGLLCGIVQLLLFVIYYKSTKQLRLAEVKLEKGQGRDNDQMQKTASLNIDLERSSSLENIHTNIPLTIPSLVITTVK